MHLFMVETSSPLASAMTELFVNSGHTIHSCSTPTDITDFKKYMAKLSSSYDMEMVILPAIPNHHQAKRPSDQKKYVDHSDICRAICNHFTSVNNKPHTLLCCSSVNIYTSYDHDVVTENNAVDKEGEWENYANVEKLVTTICGNKIRTIFLRAGLILSRESVTPLPCIPLFKHTVLTFRRDKNQMISWVSREDAVKAISFIVNELSISGPVNIVSGDHLSRYDLLNLLANQYNFRISMQLPHFLRKFLMDDKCAELISHNTKAIPLKLLEKGFVFDHISLDEYFA